MGRVRRLVARVRVSALYARALLREFRGTLAALGAALAFGMALHRAGAHGPRPSLSEAAYYTWMALLAEPATTPSRWYMELLYALYPVLGVVLVGEGVVRLGLLMASRRQGEKEWMRVMASIHRDHVVLCGLGHLGFRVLEQLLAVGAQVVVIEKAPDGRFVAAAKARGVAVLARDVKDDQALVEAGVPVARAVIIATDDDMANLEVALDARRMNPGIRVVMRLFDQQLASKLSGALALDAAFSSSALAAPVVAAMSVDGNVLASYLIEAVPYVTFRFVARAGCALVGHAVARIERDHEARVLARIPAGAKGLPPAPGDVLGLGDELVVHLPAARLAAFAAAQGPR